MVVYFVIALVALLIILTPFIGYDAFGSFVGNFTNKKSTITVIDASGESGYQQNGEFYDYDLVIRATLQIKPRVQNEINVVPVIIFKDQFSVANEFLVSPNDEILEIPLMAVIKSDYPPLTEDSSPQLVFKKNQDYVVRAGTGVFKVGMSELSSTLKFEGILPVQHCTARFRAECENLEKFHLIRNSDLLFACEEGFSEECSNTVKLCSGFVTVTLRNADCQEKRATVDIEAEGTIEWEPKDRAAVLFFRKSNCIELQKDVSKWIGSCTEDFLGSTQRTDINYRAS